MKIETTPTANEGSRLSVLPPLIWPDNRIAAGLAIYDGVHPRERFYSGADLVSGLIVGAADGAVKWLESLIAAKEIHRIRLILVLFPAGPTRESHLKAIRAVVEECKSMNIDLDIRLLPMDVHGTGDHCPVILPPTVIQSRNTQTGKTIMGIGSVGDVGLAPLDLGSLNFVFEPDPSVINAWRQWFEYTLNSAYPLTSETESIPYLVPAEGTLEAQQLWQQYETTCWSTQFTGTPVVDLKTGDVTNDSEGNKIVPWDEGATAMDPLALELERIYRSGWLVTVDEATRIKPLSIPVNATLLGQESERTFGALKQKQSFTLQVLDETINKDIEKCRKLTDVIELLSIPLSKGNRWLPNSAKELLERECVARNEAGKKKLKEALGNNVESYIHSRLDSIRRDLNKMYKELGQGDTVPEEKLEKIVDEAKNRLANALKDRIAPRPVFNSIGAGPDIACAG